ncbi:MAG: hypothetical protein HYZ75_06305 [Elusimicrobia bacterium]|nr:hypothetical protein [Elusimicrobiota bacterium]
MSQEPLPHERSRPLGSWVIPTFLVLIPLALLAGFYFIMYGPGATRAPLTPQKLLQLADPEPPPAPPPARLEPPAAENRVSSLDMIPSGRGLLDEPERKEPEVELPQAPAPARRGPAPRKKPKLDAGGRGGANTGAGWDWEH